MSYGLNQGKLLILYLLSLTILLAQDNPLPNFYHTYEDIETQLNVWDDEFGATPGSNGIIFHKEIIGYSTKDNLPFWAVKISDNADIDEDEPRVLILGQCHAEEIYGVEISMALINCFLNIGIEECFTSEIASQVMSNLRNLEIWIVPTHNPEGLRVVHGYEEETDDTTRWIQDVSYRKNKRDVNNDGLFNFDFTVEAGNDSDGVDLNRNYDFNWIFGDTLYTPDPSNCTYCSHYDYYRGEAAFSESEVAAIRDFSIEKQFLLSIAYHSSRSGNVSELVIYPWGWDGGQKYSPDFPVINDIGIKISSLILKDAVDGSTYIPTPSSSRKGNAHDWFYSETGCFQYLIEMGNANMQSTDSTHVKKIIEDNFKGAFYTLNRAWGNTNNSSMSAEKYQITGIVRDSATGVVLENAQVRILEMDGGVLKPRLTDSFGKFRRLLIQGNYTLSVLAEGYEAYEFAFTSSNSQILEHDVNLNPLPLHNVNIQLTVPDGYSGLIGLVRKTELNTHFLYLVSGENQFSWHEGFYRLTIVPENMLSPVIVDLSLIGDETISINLTEREIIFEENFDNLDNWDSGLYWTATGSLRSQSNFTYNNGLETQLTTSDIIQIEEDTEAVLEVSLKYELEWDLDSLSIGLNDFSDIQWIKHWSNQNWEFHTVYIPVILENGKNYKLVVRLKSDESVSYRGAEIESMILSVGSTATLNIINDLPVSFSLSQNYPNPFNAITNIEYSLPSDCQINITIYNLEGKMIHQLVKDKIYPKGSHSISFDTNNLGSGLYFYRLDGGYFSKTKKMIILK